MKEYTVKVFEDGSKSWYLDGERHREDGPAVERADGLKQWWLNGELHREDGPAIEGADGTKYWYLHSEQVTEEEHKRRTSGITMDDALEAGDAVILREPAERIAELESQRGELLQALEKLDSYFSSPGEDDWVRFCDTVLEPARAAIAKATGVLAEDDSKGE